MANNLPAFASGRVFHEPDADAYARQKGVELIAQENEPLVAAEEGGFATQRVSTAVRSPSARCLTRFPGHTLPGPGAGGSQIFAGALEWQRFEELARLVGVPDADGRPYSTTQAEKLAPLDNWRWVGVPQPEIYVLQPVISSVCSWGATAWSEYAQLLQDELQRAYQRDGVCGLLMAVRQAWDRGGTACYLPDALRLAESLIVKAGVRAVDPVVAFELEAAVSYWQHSVPLNIHSRGEYCGVWIEVGEARLADIKATELVVTERILQELRSLYQHGFAPIVVNEYGCNTDGSHRHTAVWLWNLLHAVGPRLRSGVCLQQGVADFVRRHAEDMGPIVVREVLRVLSELLDRDDTRQFLKSEIVPQALRCNLVSHLPVLLLNEYSACTVVKKEYDLGIGSRRVDPETYRLLAANPAYTLPARGPYHRTDRSLLPWFQILEP